MNRNGKNVFILIISCAAIILGIYMTFIKEDSADATDSMQTENSASTEMEQSGEINMKERNEHDYSGRELPAVENETDGELYNNGRDDIEVYFSNTELLDQGSMPFEAQAVLSNGVQTYLRHRSYDDVTELYIDNESYQETDEKISFMCFMDGYQEVLSVEYDFNEQTLSYAILELDEKGD